MDGSDVFDNNPIPDIKQKKGLWTFRWTAYGNYDEESTSLLHFHSMGNSVEVNERVGKMTWSSPFEWIYFITVEYTTREISP